MGAPGTCRPSIVVPMLRLFLQISVSNAKLSPTSTQPESAARRPSGGRVRALETLSGAGPSSAWRRVMRVWRTIVLCLLSRFYHHLLALYTREWRVVRDRRSG